MEGRHAETVSGFREAIQRFRELGVFFNMAQAGLAFGLAVGPSDPEARAAAEEAREIFARLKATPWVGRVDAVLSGQIQPILEPDIEPQQAQVP